MLVGAALVRWSTTDQLVQEVLSGVECETEFVSLAGRRIGPCVACLGCVKDNVCALKDDMAELREQIVAGRFPHMRGRRR